MTPASERSQLASRPPVGPDAALRRRAYQVWLAVGVVALAWFAWQLLARPLAVLLGPLLAAALLVYLLNPAVSGLERRGLNRWVGTTLVFLVLLVLLACLGLLLVPVAAAQVEQFTRAAPTLASRLGSGINDLLDRAGVDARVPPGAGAGDLWELAQRLPESDAGHGLVRTVLGGLSGLASSLTSLIVVLVAGPVIAFYVLGDLPALRRAARAVLPPARRAEVAAVAGRVNAAVAGYLRGQLLVALFVGVASTAALAAVGLPYFVLVGTLAGVTNLVPLVGPIVGAVVGAAIALATDGPVKALLVVAVLAVVQQLESHVVGPAIVGRAVRVHPLAVILALLVAAPLFGLLGMVLAVPVAAAVKILAGHWWASRTLRTEQQLGPVSRPSQTSNGDPLPTSFPCRQPENLPGGHR